MMTVHEVLVSMIEHWNDRPVEDADQFMLDHEVRIHNAYHSLWFHGEQPEGQTKGWNQVTRS